MNRLSFMRYVDEARGDERRTLEVAVPVIDGVALSKQLRGRYPGIAMRLLTFSPEHWLGAPKYVEEERAVVLDGECGIAGCCGVMARISVTPATVVWDNFLARGRPPLPDRLRFEFERQQYVEAISALPNVPTMTVGD